MKKLIIGSDHGGFAMKSALKEFLESEGHAVTDVGTHGTESVDYPDFAKAACQRFRSGQYDFGVLVCTTGIGISIAANKFDGIRAALCHSPIDGHFARAHNHANFLCFGQKTTEPALAIEILQAYLASEEEGDRHNRRVAKMNGPLALADPEIYEIVELEGQRQQNHIELIASENFTSPAVMAAQGSLLTNKYAEGYPGKRWYGGCEQVDKIETIAIERLKTLYSAEHANVQPHSGSQANAAVYFSVLKPGDTILTMDLAHGGHLTHGHPANFSGALYDVVHYGVSKSDEKIDYDALERQAETSQPKLITAGASAYSQIIDFERMAAIAKKVGAYLFIDMAHISGLVAGGAHPSPVPHADFVTSTTHKSLRGPRGGIILCKGEHAKKIDSQMFPGVQGGPLMHVIAAKAVCFGEALQPEFRAYQQQVVVNAQALAAGLAERDFRIVSGGTENHVFLVDLRSKNINGAQASTWLDEAHITANKNSIPFDTGSPFKPSGIRLGTPAVTTRGMKEAEMKQIAHWIADVLENPEDEALLKTVATEVVAFNERFPLP
ncbi:MAG: ribose 5-phosphate isomerase B [Verrucomicrobiota bacterium]